MMAEALGGEVAALRELRPRVGPGIPMLFAPRAAPLWLRCGDRGNRGHGTHELVAALAPSFDVTKVIDAVRCHGVRNLTGHVDIGRLSRPWAERGSA